MTTPFTPAPPATRYVRRLGRHHFAHLRAVAQGIAVQDSAKRYLGVDHGHAARTAHLQTRDAIRALARRHKDSAWRLLGVYIVIQDQANKPSLEDFQAERDLEDWSEREVIELYGEAYPQDKKTARRFLLQKRQLKLLYKMEEFAAEIPKPEDMVSDWYDELTAGKLISAGILTLGLLNARLARGGQWYRTLPGVGRTKAQRIASHLSTLLERLVAPLRTHFFLVPVPNQAQRETEPTRRSLSILEAYPVAQGQGASGSLLGQLSDPEAVEAWVRARAGSEITAKTYRREAVRLRLWLQFDKGGKPFGQMSVQDCGDYMAFLQNIPERWISRARAAPGEPGWAPFRGQLSHLSRTQSVVIVASLFAWLQAAQFIRANPWLLVNHKTGDDATKKMLDTKALTESAVAEILKFIDQQKATPARDRIRFILLFVESVGLRSSELLSAQLKDLSLEPEGWVMQIHGKGSKNRIAAVPGQAFTALQAYLFARGLTGIETAPETAPLLASTLDPLKPVGYQALYEHVRSWFHKALSNSALSAHERSRLSGVSTHWLRHTFGTRAIARHVPLDVIQAQMGHASIQTTTAIYGRAPIKRRVDELGKAFG